MTTEYCLIKNNLGCNSCKSINFIKDEKGENYRIESNLFCQNQVFFHKPLFFGEKYNEIISKPYFEYNEV